MIEAENLTKEFGSIRAIENVSFTVAKGEIAGFLGPNGAGKTTTMRVLAGIFPPTSGRARIAGFDVIDAPLEARRRLGYFPENAPYYPELTVESYLDYVGKLKGIDGSRRKQDVAKIVGDCGLAQVARRLVGKLSKGYRQRVGLAQSLLGDPDVLILDEPTVGLDPEQVNEIRNLIRGLTGERTILLSSHILSEVSLVCRRIIVINKGTLIAEGPPERLAERLRSSLRVSLRVEAPASEVIETLRRIPGVSAVAEEPGDSTIRLEADGEPVLREVSRVIQERRWLLLEMRRETLGLEDVFLSLVHGEGAGAAS